MKINSARSTRHRKNSKQSGIVAIDSCFALFGARQYGATTRESSDEKYSRTLISSPDPELSTPAESRHTTCLLKGKSPSVKLMSRRENKNVGQNQPNKHGQNHARIAAYRIYKRSTAQKFIKLQTLTTRDCKGPQTNMPKNVGSLKTWGPFLESPGNFSGPKSNIKI